MIFQRLQSFLRPIASVFASFAVCYVANGSPAEDGAPGTAADSPDQVAAPDHWAFQPLTDPSPPEVQASDWPGTFLDSFVLARLEAVKLQPAADADRRTLIRRLYFQLTGLPPTPEQCRKFLRDERSDAWERQVDRLLHSPHFGERWGRHWLDLARYADSNGLDENFLFREAWRYRNWVIRAVNRDIPFDQFVKAQIAGDLLPHDSIEQRDQQRIAAGFLLIGPKVLLGTDPKKQQMEVADEQLDTIGRAILGQTLGCARCHDHKFDPVPTADYYALAGILTSTEVMETRHMLGSQRRMERLFGIGRYGDELDDDYEKYWRELPKLKQRQTRAKTALKLLEKNDQKAIAELSAKHADALAAEAADGNRPPEQRIGAQKKLIAKLDAAVASVPGIPPRAMVPTDANSPRDEHVRIAGQFDRLGERVPRGFLGALGGSAGKIAEGSSGRLELGDWLTSREGAGALSARVFANRVWQHLIGQGIVRTMDNFGRRGETPSHPELLDHLAIQLIESHWSVKALVRQIALSRTFAMSSRHDQAAHTIDPENRLLWRAHRRRLDPEAMRDAMLSISQALDLAPMDSSVWYLGDQATAVGANKVRRRTNFPNRSVYLPVIRNDLPELFAAFDFADPHQTTGMRPETTVATQSLFFLNDESVIVAAEALARRVIQERADESARIERLFELIFNDSASPDQQSELLLYIRGTERQLSGAGDPEPSLRAWSLAAHALLASSRFQILE